MTRLITDGAEFGDLLLFSSYNGLTLTSSIKRSGTYSYNLNGTTQSFVITPVSALSEFYFRIGIYINADFRLKFRNGTTVMASITRNNGTGILELHFADYNSATILVNGVTALSQNTWYLLEVHLKIHDTSGIAEFKIDGSLEGSTFSGDTRNGTPTTIDNIYSLNPTGGGWYFDDIALNDTDNSDGKNDNAWCGDGHIELLMPTGNSPDGGWSDQFTGSDSNSTDNYALVDELPPNGTDYVQSETVGHQDRYQLANWTGTGKRIRRVWTEARALDVSNLGSKLKLGVRVSNGDYLSAGRVLLGTYSRVVGDEYLLNPANSSLWDDTALNAAQSLMEVSA
jgi:hypothetical protein